MYKTTIKLPISINISFHGYSDYIVNLAGSIIQLQGWAKQSKNQVLVEFLVSYTNTHLDAITR